jgi:hypothetical protein
MPLFKISRTPRQHSNLISPRDSKKEILRAIGSISLILGTFYSAWMLTRWTQPNSTRLTPSPYWPGGTQKVRLYPAELNYGITRSTKVLAKNETSEELTEEEWTLPAGAQLAILLNEGCSQSPSDWQKSRARAKKIGLEWPESTLAKTELSSSALRSPWQSLRFRIPATLKLSALEQWAAAENCVGGVSHNHRVDLTDTPPPETRGEKTNTDPLALNQSHLTAISMQAADQLFFNPKDPISRDVVLAIIDTGIDLNHPDLKDHLWVNSSEKNGVAGQDDDQDGYIDNVYGFNFLDRKGDPSHLTVNDHGTHVAGLAAAVSANGIGIAGVMGHQIKIMPLNVFGSQWQPDTVHIDEAIRYAADHGANVINISIGAIGHSDTTASAIAYALQSGAVVVTAAGNNSLNIGNEFYFPASYAPTLPGLISVGGNDAKLGQICEFSNFGVPEVKIIAPGCDRSASKQGLLSTRGNSQYGYKKGTSMSAPLVSGAAALAYGWIRDKTLNPPSPSAVEQVLLESADQVEALHTFATQGRVLNASQLARRILELFPQQTNTSPR